jgi:hypothetical protein
LPSRSRSRERLEPHRQRRRHHRERAGTAGTSGAGGPPGGGFGLGQAAITSGSEVVEITTSPSLGLILLAIGLAVLWPDRRGVKASAPPAGPAAALRTVE